MASTNDIGALGTKLTTLDNSLKEFFSAAGMQNVKQEFNAQTFLIGDGESSKLIYQQAKIQEVDILYVHIIATSIKCRRQGKARQLLDKLKQRKIPIFCEVDETFDGLPLAKIYRGLDFCKTSKFDDQLRAINSNHAQTTYMWTEEIA